MKLLIIFYSVLIIVLAVSPDPKPLPQKFTQSFTFWGDEGTLCQGKIFYDDVSLSQKLIMVGRSSYCCGDNVNSCSIMLINGTGYLFATEQKQCCYLGGLPSQIPRDVLAQYGKYSKEAKIDGQKYYLWIMDTQDLPIGVGVFTDQTEKRIMKRILLENEMSGDVDYVDFWPGSYSEKFSEKTTFEVPKYCTQQCSFGKLPLLSSGFKTNNFQKNLRFISKIILSLEQ